MSSLHVMWAVHGLPATPVSLLHEDIVPCRSACHPAPINTYTLLLGLSTKGQAYVLSGAADAMEVDTAEPVGAAIVKEPAQAYPGEAGEAAAGAVKKEEPGAVGWEAATGALEREEPGGVGWAPENGAALHAPAPAGGAEQGGAALQQPVSAATGGVMKVSGSHRDTPAQLATQLATHPQVAEAARGVAAEHSAPANASLAAGDNMVCKPDDH